MFGAGTAIGAYVGCDRKLPNDLSITRPSIAILKNATIITLLFPLPPLSRIARRSREIAWSARGTDGAPIHLVMVDASEFSAPMPSGWVMTSSAAFFYRRIALRTDVVRLLNVAR